MVEIDHDAGKGEVESPRHRQFLPQTPVHVASIGEAGEFIGEGDVGEPPVGFGDFGELFSLLIQALRQAPVLLAKIPDLILERQRFVVPGEKQTDLPGQAVHINRFRNESVATCGQRALTFPLDDAGGDGNNRVFLQIRDSAKAGGNLASIQTGDHDIHQDQVGTLGNRLFDPSRAVLGLEEAADQQPVFGIILDVEGLRSEIAPRQAVVSRCRSPS